ncbi:MAG TPA: efflux RND transporter permease subunit [Bacteroidales bacterium]|nr:MAG: Toluene efflux pump membrane transporter TtgH [Bacteroidetes bacterium ADurb.Bin139]HOG25876.1 efflux RND transporter permease subunit [Bacteroidales bacterium]HOR12137.1 efflux RND transporter permease subunit [Bacteroidales bacterium]HOZ19942.1 efflux RND transporter permease subunit [Bacteroidales bacterium]HPB78412.1 efflux RND transporter permease subunit [Bacteroidales bacterium]
MGISNFIIKYRWYIIIVTLILVLLGIIPLTKIRVNPDLESYLPQNMPSIQNNNKIGEYFGNDELLLIIFQTEDILNEKTLNRIRQITDTLSIMPQFGRVYSLFQGKDIRSEEGSMVVDPVVKRIPDNQQDRELLRKAIRSNDLVYKIVVSEDFKNALIILSSDKTVSDDQLMQLIHETLQKYPGDEEIFINGSPFLRDEASKKIGRDIMLLLPIGLLVMFLILYLSFRELRSVLLPFSVVLFSIVVSMALIPVFGWELSLIGVIIPVMMLAIANNYGVYYAARYQDLRASQPGLEPRELAKQVSSYLFTPVTLCGLTTIVGVLGLVAHLFRPARQMGVVSAIGISFALLVSLLFIPAVLSLLKKGRIHKDLEDGSKGFFPSVIERTGETITRHPKRIVSLFILFMAFCAVGLFFFRTAPDSNDVLPESHSFNKAINIMDNKFGGSKMFNVMFRSDVKDPAFLTFLDTYEQELKEVPGVGTVTSLTSIIRKISKALNDSTDPGYDRIPGTREGVAQYLELYSMSGDPEDLEQFVDFDYTSTLLTVQFKAQTIGDIRNLLSKIEGMAQEDSLEPVIGGFTLTDVDINESVEKGQYYSLLVAFVAIFLLLSLIFKSFKAGLIGSIPLAFAVFCTFGLMGWFGMELNIVTALISSISIGLGVDFTIHVFWRIKWELAHGNNYGRSIKATLKTIGRGIVINASSVMLGFAVLSLSAFPLIRSFAFLIILSLFLCLVCALILLPAICYWARPNFLEK